MSAMSAIYNELSATIIAMCCALQLGCREGLPEVATEDMLQDDGFLQRFHHALLEVGGNG